MNGMKKHHRRFLDYREEQTPIDLYDETVTPKESLVRPDQLSVSGMDTTQLFIGGMSSNTDLLALQNYLKAITTPHSGLYISIVKRLKRKTFSGYGTIKNISQEDANKLLSIGNFKFGGCWYGVKPFLKKKSAINSLRNERTAKKIYIKGITSNISEADLENYFSRFGEVLHVQIGKHQESGYYKGFGFVEFDAMEAVNTVTSIVRHFLKDAELRCEQSKLNKVNSKVADDCTKLNSKGNKEISDTRSQVKLRNYIPHLALIEISRMSTLVARNHAEENLLFRVVTPISGAH